MLLVIDAQSGYKAAELVVEEIAKEIQTAKKRGEAVIVLEYAGSGQTLRRLTCYLTGKNAYDKYKVIKKHTDDGAPEVLYCLYKMGLKPKVIRVCGVNTNACVAATVDGLRLLRARIEVLSHACANYCSGHCTFGNEGLCQEHHLKGLRMMKKWRHVVVK